MKTFSTPIQQNRKPHSLSAKTRFPALAVSMRSIMALMYAGLAAMVVVTLSIWVAGMGISTFLGVSTWVAGFIFLAVAVDNRGPVAVFQAASGIALLTLALLQNSISPDLFLITGLLLAGWVAFTVYGRLSA